MTLFRFDFDYLKNRYEYELSRKEQLTSQLTLPVAVLGLRLRNCGYGAFVLVRPAKPLKAIVKRLQTMTILLR